MFKIYLFISILIQTISGISWNQPRFCVNASWNSSGMTFADNNTITGFKPDFIFIDRNDTIYVAIADMNSVFIWFKGNSNNTRILSGNLETPKSLFVKENGDIYVENGRHHQIDKWTINSSISVPIASVISQCNGLFIDHNNRIYCSISDNYQVLKISLISGINFTQIVAGNGTQGSISTLLKYPNGIFVDEYFNLYVADSGNDRIQKFPQGQLNGTTLVGTGGLDPFTLQNPFGIAFDGNGYLYIVERSSSRVIGSGPNGFRCIIRCSVSTGSASNQLYYPSSLSFDSTGNLYVADTGNLRIQKYLLSTNSCLETTPVTYSSASYSHRVIKLSLSNVTNSWIAVAGNGSNGLASNMLDVPKGIFVDDDFNLYVADWRNDRIQFFQTETLNGTTLAGNGAPNTIALYAPTDVILDADRNIFITDWANHRIVRSGPNGFQCIIGCYNPYGSAANQFRYPISLAFDRIGNIYVTDNQNDRIQKLILIDNSFVETSFFSTKPTSMMITEQSSTYSINFRGCYSPTITLIPNDTSLTKPIRFRKSENFYINSIINFNCDQSVLFTIQWIFINCTVTCEEEIHINSSMITTMSELYVSARTFPYGFYQFKSTIQTANSSSSSSSSIYIEIIRSNIIVNLIQYGTSIITHSIDNELILNPGRYSIDPDSIRFDANTWIYQYYCQIDAHEPLLLINSSNHPCFSNATNFSSISQSSLIIPTGSLFTNRTYRFQVKLIHRDNSNLQANGYLSVIIEDNSLPMILISCIIPRMCFSNLQYQYINPTTQLSLFSSCQGNCSSLNNITWNIYQGKMNSSTNNIQWNLLFDNRMFDFLINQPPRNGSCSIDPLYGTTNTLFNIICSNWFDENRITDYSFYASINNSSEKFMLGTTFLSNLQVYLPTSIDNTSWITIIVYIRDELNAVVSVELPSVMVIPDWNEINEFMNMINNNNSIVRLLESGNQNIIAQIIISISQIINENVATRIINSSLLTDYLNNLNNHATIRDYLIPYISNLSITTSENIKLQSSILTQLTKITNELTRITSISSSNHCYQLSIALQSMANQISYEDVQTATESILQCTANTFTAINGPLQERTMVLNLDFNHANKFPDDYDTDLEAIWSNPNFFANGDDFSMETIEKNRNIYYQKQMANEIGNKFSQTLSSITNILQLHLNIDQKILINTSSIIYSLEKISIYSLSNKFIELSSNSRIKFPSTFQLLTINDTKSILLLRSILLPLAPYGYSSSDMYINLSRLVSFSLMDFNQNSIEFLPTMNNSIEFHIERDRNPIIPSLIKQNVTSMNLSLNYHFINLTRRNNLSISFHLEMYPMTNTSTYLFLYKFDQIPQINYFDGWSLFCPLNLINETFYKYFIDNKQISSHQSIVISLRELNSTEIKEFCLNYSMITNPLNLSKYSQTFSSNYELRVYTSGCYYLDSDNTWQSDGLIVGPLTNLNYTQCYSTYPTTIAASFHILPLPINWYYVFTNSDFIKNKTIYITIISVSIIYLILVIYARYQDKKNRQKSGMIALSDNKELYDYAYQIIVFTGHRADANTKSKVNFVIGGENANTDIRTFTDSNQNIFQRSGIDTFVITTPKSLGVLNYIHIWHDNSGLDSTASWFLKYIIIQDLQTKEQYYFICQRWLAVEFDDGAIERLLPVASEIEKEKYKNFLTKKVYENVSDGHLWFSIFCRIQSNKFTRVQRCTCCFVLFFITMLFNILYYGQIDEFRNIQQTDGFSIGPFYISFNQIIIGIMIELFSLFPSILLVQFFRRIRQKDDNYQYQRITFPYWCIYIAYSLSLLFVGISILFILARGIELGDLKVQKWLTSIVTGLFSSICLTQPIQILCLTVFGIIFFSKKNRYIQSIDDLNWNSNEKLIHTIEDRPSVRLNRIQLSNARSFRLKEIHFRSIINEFLSYGFFLCMIYLITYFNCNSQAFYQVNHLRHLFLRSHRTNFNYNQIKTIDDCWSWLENSFSENIRAQKWYNNQPARYLAGFINDKSNRLIGWATMRQLRVKSNSCEMKSIIKDLNLTCTGEYSDFNEEQRSFTPEWKNKSMMNYSSSIMNAFKYRSKSQLDTYVYIGEHETYNSGGYIYEFRGRLLDLKTNLSLLHQFNWIDHQTRAILIQMSLYNPNIQMFISSNFLLEFLPTGGIFPTARFEPFNIKSFTSCNEMIMIIIYMLFILYFLIDQCRSITHLKLSYFSKFWSWINLGIIICSWSAVGIYIWRYNESKRIGNLFRKTNGYTYINLQFAIYLNDIFNFLLSFCCFFGTIKLIDMLRFQQRLSIFTNTLEHARKDLILFMFMFSIVFVAFIALFYQLFQAKIWSCSSLLRTSAMLFEMILLKFDVTDLYKADQFLGPIFIDRLMDTIHRIYLK
ncbi:hypothetical protein I4U23_005873 [Adineta vaga]|nr:hypothetical protein I4U23_005873 [Adineta vaga]